MPRAKKLEIFYQIASNGMGRNDCDVEFGVYSSDVEQYRVHVRVVDVL